jgi:hypothetical protein
MERIRAQREREAAAERESTSNHNNGVDVESNTSASTLSVHIPDYDIIASDAVGGGGGNPGASSSFGISGCSMDLVDLAMTNEANLRRACWRGINNKMLEYLQTDPVA